MKTRYLSVLGLCLLGCLASCNNPEEKVSAGGGEDSASSQAYTGKAEHWDYTRGEHGPTVYGDPQPECIPMHSPRDYEGVTPAQADPYDAFFFISHRKNNTNTLAVAYGEAIGSVGSLGTYTQKIASMTMNYNSTVFQYFTSTGDITIGSAGSGLEIPTIDEGARAFEDIDKGIYCAQETKNGADITIDENPVDGEFAGEAHEFGGVQEDPNRQALLDEFGHDLFSTTAYFVPDRSAIQSASMVPNSQDGYYDFTFTFSLDDNGGHTDAAKYYRRTLNGTLAGGAMQFVITELTFTATVDSDWNLIRSHAVEKYDVSVASFINVPVVNQTDTYCYPDFDTLEDLKGAKGSREALEFWNEFVTVAQRQDSIPVADLD